METPLLLNPPLQITINDAPYTITMYTPGDELDLVRGLLFAEDIYKNRKQLFDYSFEENDSSQVSNTHIKLNIDPAELGDGYMNSRSILSVSSCGICGKRELEDLCVVGDRIDVQDQIRVKDLEQMFTKMKGYQTTFSQTGGSHAAAAFYNRWKSLTSARRYW